mmetsp:Transcript_36320/g.51368  ORF Transcript_36320/g.51368 Transcript_36320/m.51368 type:complete len:120 (+) Transcript_36320:702-1061(+)
MFNKGADTTPLFDIVDGLPYSADLNTELTVVATTSGPCVGVSVFLALTGPVDQGKWESFEPYCLFGDDGANYREGGYFDAGTYEIAAFPYNVDDENGLTMSFTLSNGPAGPAPTPVPVP